MKRNQYHVVRRTLLLSNAASMVLHIGLPIVMIEMIVFVICFLKERGRNAAYALYRYPAMLEYILMSLTLIIIGAFLFDYISKREK